MAAPPEPAGRVDVVVFSNSRLAALETHRTRWREVLTAWAADERVARLTVVDPPVFRPRLAFAPWRRGGLVTAQPSWLDGASSFAVAVPAKPSPPRRMSARGWARARRAVRRAAGRAAGKSALPQLVVSVNPLANGLVWTPKHGRRAFDAVDDWTAWDWAAPYRPLVEAGYGAAASFDAVTCVSAALRERLEAFGVSATVVGNGIDAASFRADGPRSRLVPKAPYAIYVGSIEGRVDTRLLGDVVVAGVPVVVAGPAELDAINAMSSVGVRWIGPQPPDALGPLLTHAAVGLMPHHASGFTASMDPMKVHEYRAAGLPVVSTVALADDLAGDDAVHVEPQPTAFVARVVALADPDAPRPAAAVTRPSWPAVADHLLDVFWAR